MNPLGGYLNPLMRTLTHLVERGRLHPAATRWVELRIDGFTLPVEGPSYHLRPHDRSHGDESSSHDATQPHVGLTNSHVNRLIRPWALYFAR